MYAGPVSSTLIQVVFSSPFIEERLYLNYIFLLKCIGCSFSSPFIEERLYLSLLEDYFNDDDSSRPLLSRSGCICRKKVNYETKEHCSRPLLSRSGCI